MYGHTLRGGAPCETVPHARHVFHGERPPSISQQRAPERGYEVRRIGVSGLRGYCCNNRMAALLCVVISRAVRAAWLLYPPLCSNWRIFTVPRRQRVSSCAVPFCPKSKALLLPYTHLHVHVRPGHAGKMLRSSNADRRPMKHSAT